MPKNTFFNLPKDKMARIVEVAIDEFAEYTYKGASINRIVEGADIAKGSFYQYFADKEELYKYIVEEAEKKRLSYLTDVIENQYYSSYFKSLKELFLAQLKFAINLPKLSSIIMDFKKNHYIELKDEVMSHYKDNEVFEKLILIGIDNRDIDDSIDIKLNNFLMSSLNLSILEYFTYEAKYDYMETTKYIENIVELIKNGIKVKKGLTRSVEDRFY